MGAQVQFLNLFGNCNVITKMWMSSIQSIFWHMVASNYTGFLDKVDKGQFGAVADITSSYLEGFSWVQISDHSQSVKHFLGIADTTISFTSDPIAERVIWASIYKKTLYISIGRKMRRKFFLSVSSTIYSAFSDFETSMCHQLNHPPKTTQN